MKTERFLKEYLESEFKNIDTDTSGTINLSEYKAAWLAADIGGKFSFFKILSLATISFINIFFILFL